MFENEVDCRQDFLSYLRELGNFLNGQQAEVNQGAGNSRSTSVAQSSAELSTLMWALPSSVDRSRPLGGCRLHPQIRFLHMEEGCTFLQCPAKGVELYGLGIGGTHLGREVLSDDVRVGVTSVMFCASLPKRMSKGRQSFLPRDDGTFSAVKLPLPSKEGAAPVARQSLSVKEMRPYASQQAMVGVTIKNQAQTSIGTR
jgi:hypothetical protein